MFAPMSNMPSSQFELASSITLRAMITERPRASFACRVPAHVKKPAVAQINPAPQVSAHRQTVNHR
jgi:hypothetical protein